MPPLPTKVQAGYYYDSDGDGLDDTYVPDPWEDPAYYGYSTPPSDQDGDGWEDSLDPFPADARLNPQTDPDADGVPSELEWFYGMNDLDPADGAADLDGDGFSNAEAFQQGWGLDAALVSPVPDFDGDRLNDITEAHWAQVHPGSLDPGNPLDPVADYDQDGVMNFEELTWGLDLASPTSPATGEDLAFMQLATGDYAAFVTPGYPGYSATDPDADGLPSLLEYQLQLDPRSADSDEDGVSDGEEDTDGDGFGNLAEVAAGTLPGQAASHPEASPPGTTGGDGSGSTNGTGNEQGNGNGATGSAVPPVGGTALAATTDLHLRVRSLKVSGGTITRHSQDEWIYTSGSGTSSEEMAAMKADGWDLSDSFSMDIPTGTDPDGLPTGYETWYWWNAKKQVGVAGETILPFSGPSGEFASDQAVSEAYADEPGQVYQEDVSGELNLNNPASGDVFTGWEEGGGVKVVSEFAASKQSTPVSDTGLYPQGEAAEVWVEGSASEVAQRKTYLILGSSTMFQWAPVWQGAGTVTFLLEPGMTGVGRVEAMTGAPPWVSVHNGRLWVEPPVEQGMTNVVRLLPVEILVPKEGSTSTGFVPNDLVETGKLKVAKWEDAFEGTSQNPTVKQDFNEGDIDRFYLKVPMPWKKGEGTATVRIKTDSDPENEIEVTEIPGEEGVFRTKGLILVSNDADDDPDNKYSQDGTDEGIDDVTHKVNLRDAVSFSIKLPDGSDVLVNSRVRKRGTLRLKTWLFNSSYTRTPDQVSRVFQIATETLAQVGLEIDSTPITGPKFSFTTDGGYPKLDLFEYAEHFQEVQFTNEGKQFMQQFDTPDSLDLYFLDGIKSSSFNTMGQAMMPSFIATLPNEVDPVDNVLKFSNKAFILDQHISDAVFGYDGFGGTEGIVIHEMLHLLGLEHEEEPTNLMRQSYKKWNDSPQDQKRLTSEQEKIIFFISRPCITIEN